MEPVGTGSYPSAAARRLASGRRVELDLEALLSAVPKVPLSRFHPPPAARRAAIVPADTPAGAVLAEIRAQAATCWSAWNFDLYAARNHRHQSLAFAAPPGPDRTLSDKEIARRRKSRGRAHVLKAQITADA